MNGLLPVSPFPRVLERQWVMLEKEVQSTPGPCLGTVAAGQLARKCCRDSSHSVESHRNQTTVCNVLILKSELTVFSISFWTTTTGPLHMLFLVLETVSPLPQASLSPQSLLPLPPCRIHS